MHMDISEEAAHARIYIENAPDQDFENPAGQTSCEPAQSKYTWTSHKNNFMQKLTPGIRALSVDTLAGEFTGKCRTPRRGQPRYPRFVRACAVEMHMDISQEPLYAITYRKRGSERSVWTHWLGNLREKYRAPRPKQPR